MPARRQVFTDDILALMPATRKEIEAATGLSAAAIWHVVDNLRYCKWAHIGGWCRGENSGEFQAVIHAGHGADVTCKLVKYTKAEVARRYKARLKKSGEIEEFRAKQRAKERADRAAKKATPNTWLSALGL